MTDPEKLIKIRHSLAHVLAAAVQEIYPQVKFGIGPVIENGFFYDFDFDQEGQNFQLSPEALPEIEKRMRQIIKKGLEIEHLFIPLAEAVKEAKTKGQKYKLELLEEIKSGSRPSKERGSTEGSSPNVRPSADSDAEKIKDGTVSFYKIGSFIDLCKGPHVQNTKALPTEGFKLLRIAGAYWRGQEKNKMLTRLYAAAFAKPKELKDYLDLLEEVKKRDHKKLGPELDLFIFSDLVGSGLPLFTPKGTIIRDLLDNFVWELRKKHGYQRVDVPHLTKKDLYEKSGHWEKFKDELFKINTREGHVFALKPMNCPHHAQIFARKLFSYRDLPQRYSSTTKVYRDEQSGELAGLSRVRSITQDDAHVFCRHAQVQEEISKIWEVITEFYQAVGFKLSVHLSLHDPQHPEKYLGTEKIWENAENQLRAIVKKKKAKALEVVGEAAFYGPKIDFMAKDSLGREWQVATIQLDLNLPERFDLNCVNEKGEQERIVMIHAAIMGSIERYLAILIEHFAGAFPFWLAPVQVMIVPISDKFLAYAQQVEEQLRQAEIRIELDRRSESVGKKIREAELQKIPYILVVGEREEKEKTVAVRQRGQATERERGSTEAVEEQGSEILSTAVRMWRPNVETMKIEKFIQKITQEIKDKN